MRFLGLSLGILFIALSGVLLGSSSASAVSVYDDYILTKTPPFGIDNGSTNTNEHRSITWDSTYDLGVFMSSLGGPSSNRNFQSSNMGSIDGNAYDHYNYVVDLIGSGARYVLVQNGPYPDSTTESSITFYVYEDSINLDVFWSEYDVTISSDGDWYSLTIGYVANTEILDVLTVMSGSFDWPALGYLDNDSLYAIESSGIDFNYPAGYEGEELPTAPSNPDECLRDCRI